MQKIGARQAVKLVIVGHGRFQIDFADLRARVWARARDPGSQNAGL